MTAVNLVNNVNVIFDNCVMAIFVGKSYKSTAPLVDSRHELGYIPLLQSSIM